MRSQLRCATRRRPHGQAIVWAAVMLPLFLSVVGLAIDAGVVFDARRELQDVADAAARAGAMQVDQQIYRSSSGKTVVLDQPAARQVAAQYIADQSSGIMATITIDPQRVVVEVSRNVPTSFLRLVGLSTIRVSAVATAAARYGISGPNP